MRAGNAAGPAQGCRFCRGGVWARGGGSEQEPLIEELRTSPCGWSSVMLGDFYQVKSKSWVGPRTRTNNLKICMETRESEKTLRNKDGAGGIRLPDFRLCRRATVFKAAWR